VTETNRSETRLRLGQSRRGEAYDVANSEAPMTWGEAAVESFKSSPHRLLQATPRYLD